MIRTDHVLLTRFNLPTQGVEGLVRARDGWLRDRVALFERYCAPSVAEQTVPITWIVYFDPESPRWLLERLRPFVRRRLFRPIQRASVGTTELLDDIRETVGTPADMLITTNLDNDDGLAVDFAARIRSVVTPHTRVVIYLTRGLIRTDNAVYLRKDRRNAFCSVREPWADAVTSWSEYHNEFPRTMPAVELGGPPAWLQVVHGANVSNRVRGRLIDPGVHQARYAALLEDVRAPAFGELAIDALLRCPGRFVRDTARSAVRAGGLGVLGKDRYQQLKARLTVSSRAALTQRVE